jgi:phosphohistidine phosphatase
MAVDLYIVRHAIAAERGPEWPDDDKRPLIQRGVERFKESVDGLVWMDVQLDIVFTSPLVRARQTAELLSAGLPEKPPIKIADALAPGHTAAEVMEQIARDARGETRVALVGHEPDLGELAAWLLGAKRPVPFKKGGICRIEMDMLSARHGTLAWHATPKMLRKLGSDK